MSQPLTIPLESDVKAIASFDCRITDRIGAEGRDMGFGSIMAGSVNWAPICQNLTDLLQDAEMRVVGEENIREVILPV